MGWAMDSKDWESELRQDPASQTAVPVYVAYVLLRMKHRRKELGVCFSFEEWKYFSVVNK